MKNETTKKVQDLEKQLERLKTRREELRESLETARIAASQASKKANELFGLATSGDKPESEYRQAKAAEAEAEARAEEIQKMVDTIHSQIQIVVETRDAAIKERAVADRKRGRAIVEELEKKFIEDNKTRLAELWIAGAVARGACVDWSEFAGRLFWQHRPSPEQCSTIQREFTEKHKLNLP